MSLPSIAIFSWHNASIAVYQDGQIVSVIEFERIINKKNASFDFFAPIQSRETILKEILKYLKFEYGFEKFDKFIIGYSVPEVPQKYYDLIPANEYIYDSAHHTAHASNGLYQSTHNKAIIVSFDGGSNEGYFNVFLGEKGQELELLAYFPYDMGSNYHVIGSVCSEIKNYDALTAAGKVLGLQSYGEVVEEWKEPLRVFFKDNPPYYFELDKRIERLSKELNLTFSTVEQLSGKSSYDLARTAQEVFEEIFFECVDDILVKNDLPVIIAGGCALNIVLNTRIKEKYNKEVFVAPNSSDCGIAVGLLCKYFKPTNIIDVTYKGVSPLDKYSLMEYVEHRGASEVPLSIIVDDLIQNRILGVVQGNAEHGPRALGNRSIICSPISPDMKDVLNLKVKHREWYRPFAPIVRLEDVSEYFEWEGESRWMNFCPKVRPEYLDKIPAVVHVDGTARVQTVTREQNEFIYDLLTEFKEKTGIGVLVNTSFNVDGKPILSTYKDAFKVFDETQLDRLYLDGYYFRK
jgi:carbamoyltransferase